MSDDPRTVFVGNLNENVTDSLLRELFHQVGPVDKVNIPCPNGKRSQFGFVVFKHECSVPYAKALLDGTFLFERSIKVNPKGGQYVPQYNPSPLLLGLPERRPEKRRHSRSETDDQHILRGFNPGMKRPRDDNMKPHQQHRKRHKPNKDNVHIPDSLGHGGPDDEYHQKHDRQWKRHNDRSHKFDHNRHMHPKKFNHRHKDKKNRNHKYFED